MGTLSSLASSPPAWHALGGTDVWPITGLEGGLTSDSGHRGECGTLFRPLLQYGYNQLIQGAILYLSELSTAFCYLDTFAKFTKIAHLDKYPYFQKVAIIFMCNLFFEHNEHNLFFEPDEI